MNGLGCCHYGAKPMSRCYCGALVSRLDWLMAQVELSRIRAALGAAWLMVRDADGKSVRMEWRS